VASFHHRAATDHFAMAFYDNGLRQNGEMDMAFVGILCIDRDLVCPGVCGRTSCDVLWRGLREYLLGWLFSIACQNCFFSVLSSLERSEAISASHTPRIPIVMKKIPPRSG